MTRDVAPELYPHTIRALVKLVAAKESPRDVPSGEERIRARSGISPSLWRKIMAGDGLSPPSRGAMAKLVAALMATPSLTAWDGSKLMLPTDVVTGVLAARRRWLERQWSKLNELEFFRTAIADQGMRLLEESPELMRETKTGPESGECQFCWSRFVDGVGPAAVGVPPPGFGEGEEHWMCGEWFRNGTLTEAGREELERREANPPAADDLPTRPVRP
jgi:hypothetical protein